MISSCNYRRLLIEAALFCVLTQRIASCNERNSAITADRRRLVRLNALSVALTSFETPAAAPRRTLRTVRLADLRVRRLAVRLAIGAAAARVFRFAALRAFFFFGGARDGAGDAVVSVSVDLALAIAHSLGGLISFSFARADRCGFYVADRLAYLIAISLDRMIDGRLPSIEYAPDSTLIAIGKDHHSSHDFHAMLSDRLLA
jgi:hypothetical protein